MTDTKDWRRLIHVATVGTGDWHGEPTSAEYAMIPLNPYQMGNLIDAVAQAPETGDWYGEFCDIIAVAMEKWTLTKLSSNRGTVYTYEQIRARLLAQPEPSDLKWQRESIVACAKAAETDLSQAGTVLKRAFNLAKGLQSMGLLAPEDAWAVDELARRVAALQAVRSETPPRSA
jgi:hypothetical protein